MIPGHYGCCEPCSHFPVCLTLKKIDVYPRMDNDACPMSF